MVKKNHFQLKFFELPMTILDKYLIIVKQILKLMTIVYINKIDKCGVGIFLLLALLSVKHFVDQKYFHRF